MLSRMSLTGSKRWLMSGTRRTPSRRERTTQTVRSVYYLESAVTGVSKQSFVKRVAEAGKAEAKPEWDAGSATSEARQKRAEDRMASKIAMEVLKDNSKLRGVHSKESIKKILEKEALKQMGLPTEYAQPVISRLVERSSLDKSDPSNLPYLHKNPAV